MSRLTGLKVSSLTCNCVFFRLEHNAKEDNMELNFEGPAPQKWNTPTARAQIVDGKNGAICQVIMFNHRNMVSKVSKIVHFFIFCW